jgi:hypothetical protein
MAAKDSGARERGGKGQPFLRCGPPLYRLTDTPLFPAPLTEYTIATVRIRLGEQTRLWMKRRGLQHLRRVLHTAP